MLDAIVVQIELLELFQRPKRLRIEHRDVVLPQTQLAQMRETLQTEPADREQLGVDEFYFLSAVSRPGSPCARVRKREGVRYLCVLRYVFEDLGVVDVGLLIFAILVLLVARVSGVLRYYSHSGGLLTVHTHLSTPDTIADSEHTEDRQRRWSLSSRLSSQVRW